MMNFEKIYALGTTGWMPNKIRQTACFLIKAESRIILLDAGTGLSRLLLNPFKEIIKSVSEIYILLSHYHYDHIVGIGYIPLFFEGKVVKIFAPGKELSGFNSKKVLNQIFSNPVFGLPLDKFPMELFVEDLKPGTNRITEGFIVETIKQKHSDPSVGLRINHGLITYITDTCCSEETVKFVNNSHILFHEAYYDHLDYQDLISLQNKDTSLLEHSYSLGVAEISLKAGVTRSYLIHLNPEYDEERLKNMEKKCQTIIKQIYVPEDLDEIII